MDKIVDTNLKKLEEARDKIAAVYNDEATDEKPDNGNLTLLNDVLLKINELIIKHK